MAIGDTKGILGSYYIRITGWGVLLTDIPNPKPEILRFGANIGYSLVEFGASSYALSHPPRRCFSRTYPTRYACATPVRNFVQISIPKITLLLPWICCLARLCCRNCWANQKNSGKVASLPILLLPPNLQA